jgi:hypothetical protein
MEALWCCFSFILVAVLMRLTRGSSLLRKAAGFAGARRRAGRHMRCALRPSLYANVKFRSNGTVRPTIRLGGYALGYVRYRCCWKGRHSRGDLCASGYQPGGLFGSSVGTPPLFRAVATTTAPVERWSRCVLLDLLLGTRQEEDMLGALEWKLAILRTSTVEVGNPLNQHSGCWQSFEPAQQSWHLAWQRGADKECGHIFLGSVIGAQLYSRGENNSWWHNGAIDPSPCASRTCAPVRPCWWSYDGIAPTSQSVVCTLDRLVYRLLPSLSEREEPATVGRFETTQNKCGGRAVSRVRGRFEQMLDPFRALYMPYGGAARLTNLSLAAALQSGYVLLAANRLIEGMAWLYANA